MLLYHGSNIAVERPGIMLSNRGLDFGAGFYTTSREQQAVDFTFKVAQRTDTNTRIVSVYEFDENTSDLDILRFSEPDAEWLEFIRANRFKRYSGKLYDVVIGAVANDDVFPTLQLFFEQNIDAETAIALLKVKNLYDQYCFLTENGLKNLEFIRSYKVREGDTAR